MLRQRCCNIGTGCYFFTVSLCDKDSELLVSNIDLLWESIADVRSEKPFYLDAVVVLPDHLHAIMTLPGGDTDHKSRWRAIKEIFNRKLAKQFGRQIASPWQESYLEQPLCDHDDYRYCVDYIHCNPVKHGHVRKVRDWPYSSFDRFVNANIYPVNWNGCPSSCRVGEHR